jgi:hypothetical protein
MDLIIMYFVEIYIPGMGRQDVFEGGRQFSKGREARKFAYRLRFKPVKILFSLIALEQRFSKFIRPKIIHIFM